MSWFSYLDKSMMKTVLVKSEKRLSEAFKKLWALQRGLQIGLGRGLIFKLMSGQARSRCNSLELDSEVRRLGCLFAQNFACM